MIASEFGTLDFVASDHNNVLGCPTGPIRVGQQGILSLLQAVSGRSYRDRSTANFQAAGANRDSGDEKSDLTGKRLPELEVEPPKLGKPKPGRLKEKMKRKRRGGV